MDGKLNYKRKKYCFNRYGKMSFINKNILVTGVDGFIALAECEESIGQIVNVGSNYEISIKDTLDLIKKIL
jgi:hypothetical protein